MEWPLYESHKLVRAARIVGVGPRPDIGHPTIWVRPDGEEFDDAPIEQFFPTVPAMADKAEIGGAAMLYPDGYRSISPGQAFDEGYTRVGLGD